MKTDDKRGKEKKEEKGNDMNRACNRCSPKHQARNGGRH